MGDTRSSFVQHMLAVTFGTLADWSQRHEKSPVCDRTADETEVIAQRAVKVQKGTAVHTIGTADRYTLITKELKKRGRYEELTTCYYQTYGEKIVGVCEKFAGFDEFHYDQCKSIMADSFSKCLFTYETRSIDTFTSVIKLLCGVHIDYFSIGQALGQLAIRMELPMPQPPPKKPSPPPAPPGPDGMPPA